MKHSTKWAVLFAIVLVMGLFSFGGSQQTVMTATPYQCGGGSPYNPEETCYTYTNSQPNGWEAGPGLILLVLATWCALKSNRAWKGERSKPAAVQSPQGTV
ncbi:MAG: hypothetical protein WBX00_10985 [Isosphaeraceae bacterium]